MKFIPFNRSNGALTRGWINASFIEEINLIHDDKSEFPYQLWVSTREQSYLIGEYPNEQERKKAWLYLLRDLEGGYLEGEC